MLGFKYARVLNFPGFVNMSGFSISRITQGLPIFVNRHGSESEAATRGVLCKKVFLQISQNSQETPVPESLRTPFSQNTSGRLLLLSMRLDAIMTGF